MPDPLAEALSGQNLWHGRYGSSPAGTASAAAIRAALAERGYVIVNAEMLAAALQVAMTDTRKSVDYAPLAAAIIAAIREKP